VRLRLNLSLRKWLRRGSGMSKISRFDVAMSDCLVKGRDFVFQVRYFIFEVRHRLFQIGNSGADARDLVDHHDADDWHGHPKN
jgi:hypothetical protein